MRSAGSGVIPGERGSPLVLAHRVFVLWSGGPAPPARQECSAPHSGTSVPVVALHVEASLPSATVRTRIVSPRRVVLRVGLVSSAW